MRAVKANDMSPTPSETNATGSGIVDVVIERINMLTRKQWFPSDNSPAPTTGLHHESDAKTSTGTLMSAGTFPVFSDCGHQRSGRLLGLHSGVTAAFGFRPPAAPKHSVTLSSKTGVPMSAKLTALALVGGIIFSSLAVADASTDRVRAGIARYTGGKVEVSSVSATPIPGIFEVVSGTDVFYSDSTGRYALVDGRLVDTEKRQDLTQATLQKVSSIDFKKLPLDLAIKTVIGTGKRQLAIFEDPSCSVCRDLHGNLAQLTDVTIYSLPLPIISEDSTPAAAMALCAPSARRAAKWHAYMSGTETIPSQVDPGCEPALEKVGKLISFSNQYKIQNTPTMVLGNGQRIVGRVPVEILATALDASMAK